MHPGGSTSSSPSTPVTKDQCVHGGLTPRETGSLGPTLSDPSRRTDWWTQTHISTTQDEGVQTDAPCEDPVVPVREVDGDTEGVHGRELTSGPGRRPVTESPPGPLAGRSVVEASTVTGGYSTSSRSPSDL
ncbi:Hypothetical predicted protein [Marmota monax]|uniref:Uncharacterized protein n=1 Tax=Marmota monax TaxID=9995 RepID=A0A5E4ABW6_MARMO|nr:Hypothetical predicted protein [Marmota monax]